jgi:ribosomal-protein-alanine N-acetyltransferase
MQLYMHWMARQDFEMVLEIERACFESPWTEQELLDAVTRRGQIGLVATDVGESVVGFVIYRLRRSAFWVLDFAVAPARQREGVGSAILAKLKARLSPTRRSFVVMDVSEYNTGAHLFLRACGFRATRVLRDYYSNGDAAYRFEYRRADLEQGSNTELSDRLSE